LLTSSCIRQVLRKKMATKAKQDFNKNVEKFKELTAKTSEDQAELFLKSFILDLDEEWKRVPELNKKFRQYLRDHNEFGDALNLIQASDFLQQQGAARTANERKEELRDVDLDSDQKICFIEYLLLVFKPMILTAYQKRTGIDLQADLSKGGIGVVGVGPELLDELFTMPEGLPPELVKAIEEYQALVRERETKMRDLNEKVKAGGVKGLASGNELKQLEAQDSTEVNRVGITLEAARRKASKTSGEEALRKKKQVEEDEKKKTAADSKARLAAKRAAFQ